MVISAARRPLRLLLLIATASALALAGLTISSSRSTAQPAGGPKRVVGTLVLSLTDAKEKKLDIDLPNRTVMLRNANGADVAHTNTALNGAFELIAPNP